MKLRTKMFVCFSILAIIPLSVLTAFAFYRYIQTTRQRMDEISSTMFDHAVTAANEKLDQINQTTSLFNFYYSDGSSFIETLTDFSDSDNPPDSFDFYKADRQFKHSCQNALYVNDYMNGIYVLTPSDYIFSYSNNKNGTINLSVNCKTASWYRKVLESDGETYVSIIDDHKYFTGKEKSVFFARKLEDLYSHKLLGVLVIDCDPSIFDMSLSNTLPDLAILTIDNTNTNDVLYTNIDSVQTFTASTKKKVYRKELNIPGLRITSTVDYTGLFREYSVTGVMMILLSVFSAIMILIFSYLISAGMTRPLEHLSRKMSTQKGHSLELTSKYLNRVDEIGTLYNEYNAMVDSLNAAIKQDYQDKLIGLDAQMKSLEARINSHFLFNTLESINSMAELDEDEQIATMSLALGNMFRYTLKTQSELVPVQDELNHVKDYVAIQSIRFDSRFHLDCDLDMSFRQEPVLKLILQPLVENALYHGLNYCSTGDTIRISGYRDNGCLYIDVWDNGQGMNDEQLQGLSARLNEEVRFTELGHRNKQSIGLKNIHTRIELYYGRGYGLTITSQEGVYTNVRIKLPVRYRKD